MRETNYLKLELQNIGNLGTWTRDPRKKGNIVLGDINTLLAHTTPEGFERGDKTAGLRIARLRWLSSIVDRTLTSSVDLYPVEAIYIRNWLDGRVVSTGENEPDQDDLAMERQREVLAWMEEHWTEIMTATRTRPNRRKNKRSTLQLATSS